MENRENKNPSTGSESDISKSQAQQQPPTSQDRQPSKGQGQSGSEQSQDNASSRPDQPGSSQSGFGETATQQRSDVEGSSLGKEPTSEAESGFVGSEGKTDTSSKLVEDEEQKFRKDGQGAPDGKYGLRHRRSAALAFGGRGPFFVRRAAAPGTPFPARHAERSSAARGSMRRSASAGDSGPRRWRHCSA